MDLRDSEIIDEVTPAAAGLAVGLDAAVLAACRDALRREEIGDYRAAQACLADYWGGLGERPTLEGLGEEAQAELLLRSGAISGKLGSTQQFKGAQEIAKDLISHGSRLYEEIGDTEKIAECQLELAICYWREGGVEEARDTLTLAVEKNPNPASEQRLKSIVTLGVFESSASRYQEALKIFSDVAPLLKNSSHLLQGVFHDQNAVAYKNLAKAPDRSDLIDRAFIEYAAAAYHFERAGHTRYLGFVEGNLGYLYLTAKKPLEAHQHLNRARALFVKLRDKGVIARVDETRAQAFLAQGLHSQAETTVSASVRVLEEGDEASALAEALITHGTALAKLERFERSFTQLKRAIDAANQAGNKEKAGLAALTIVENLSQYVPPVAMRVHYTDAERHLVDSQIPDLDVRLGRCARKVLALEETRVDEAAPPLGSVKAIEESTDCTVAAKQSSWQKGSLEQEVMRYERELIQEALESVGGSVTRAARLLGITHQGLAFILNGRHRSLLNVRTPVRKRRKSIFKPD